MDYFAAVVVVDLLEKFEHSAEQQGVLVDAGVADLGVQVARH